MYALAYPIIKLSCHYQHENLWKSSDKEPGGELETEAK